MDDDPTRPAGIPRNETAGATKLSDQHTKTARLPEARTTG